MNPEQTQIRADQNQNEAIELLNKLLNNENVSRWDILEREKDIIRILNSSDDYDSIASEVIDLLDSAKESL